MAAAKPKKPGGGRRARHGTSIPKGDGLLPGVDTKDLQRMHKELSGRKEVRKEALIVAAAIKWREGPSVSEIAKQLLQPRSTVRGWLVRLRDRGLEGISDRTAPNHRPILGDIHWLVIGVWLSHSPQAYGFESGLWQTSMVCKMILDRLGKDIKPRTLRGTLRRMRFCRTLREVPRKSADPPDVQKIHQGHPEEDGRPRRGGARHLLRGRDSHAAGRPDGQGMAADAAAARRQGPPSPADR